MNRVQMLDIVRGCAMFFICGGEWVLLSLFACFPECATLQTCSKQLGHVAWEGLTFLDVIFPAFLLISGASFTFSWNRQIERGVPAVTRWRKLFLRTLLLVVLGIIYNGALSKTSLDAVRYASVLGRIGLGVFLAAIPYTLLSVRWRWLFLPLGLAGYALLFKVCGGATPYAQFNNWAGSIDAAWLPGVTDEGVRPGLDAEGFVSTLAAPLTAYIGMLLGDLVRSGIKAKALWMVGAGALLIAVAYGMEPWVPVIKRLWTSSFVCLTGGWTLVFCGLIYTLADQLHLHCVFIPFSLLGRHALTVYFLAHFVDFRAIAWQFVGGPAQAFVEDKATLNCLWASAGFLLLWGMMWWLERVKAPVAPPPRTESAP